MSSSTRAGFVQGLVAGAALTFLMGFTLLYVLQTDELYFQHLSSGTSLKSLLAWIYQNLGLYQDGLARLDGTWPGRGTSGLAMGP